MIKTMADVVEKRDVIRQMPVPGSAAVVRQDLKDMKSGAQGFQQAMLAGAQDDILPASKAIIDSTNEAFDSAIAAFS
ncbi:hypothetical protein CVT24_000426 [Panaeolus cyanescens]|uniref:Uncharacterized protein n=1 Tax=Panaeolus cyanescens TaxID=181874 RepID=A0A409WP60_9AGAR|nr:hypothetical protein CVT24_000426 [Panaeolus cyanescens]